MVRRISTVASLLALMSLAGWGQEFRATLTGRILDSSGATIAGATVKAVNSATQETNTVTTDTSGVSDSATDLPEHQKHLS